MELVSGDQPKRFGVRFWLVIAVVFFAAALFSYTIYRNITGNASTSLTNLTKVSYSDSFVDSVGVNTHMDSQYYNISSIQLNPTTVQNDVLTLINNLGVRHIRDAAAPATQASWVHTWFSTSVTVPYYNQLKALTAKGVGVITPATNGYNAEWKVITCDKLATDTMAILLQAQCAPGVAPADYATTSIVLPALDQTTIQTAVGNMISAGIKVEAIEGYNEYHTYIPGSLAGKTADQIYPANWEQVISLYTQKVTKPAATALGIQAIGPSIVPMFGNATNGCATWYNYSPPLFASATDKTCGAPATPLSDLSSTVDYSNTHAYQSTYGGGVNAWLNGNNVKTWWNNVFSSSKPKIFTEVGYPDTQFVPAVQEKYTARSLFELFNSGVKRTYLYELLDETDKTGIEGSFGLAGFNSDGTVKLKPSYTALQNIITLLKDSGGTSFPLVDPGISLSDPSGGNVHNSVFQNSSGDYYVALWNEPATASTATDSTISNVSLSFTQKSDISVFRPSTSATTTLQTASSASSITLSVPDDILLIKVHPIASSKPAIIISSPTSGATLSGVTNISASATNGSNTITSMVVKADSTVIGSYTASPYSFSWDTSTVANGSHSLVFTATDNLGNTNTSTMTVNVSNATRSLSSTIHVSDLAAVGTKNNIRWTAKVTISVVNSSNAIMPGVAVTGSWGGGLTGNATCTTDSTGKCSVTSASLSTSKSLTFSVTLLAASGYTYNATANTDPDTDSNGTIITVKAPGTTTGKKK